MLSTFSFTPKAGVSVRTQQQRQPKANLFARAQGNPQPIPVPVPVKPGRPAYPVQQPQRGLPGDLYTPTQSPILAEKGLPKSANGRGKLWTAVFKNDHKTVDQLLKNKEGDINEQDKDGFTPLAVAVRYSNDAMVKKLLQSKDVDVNKPNADGMTPLILAARYGRTHILQQLANHASVKLHEKDNKGYTALQWTKHYFNSVNKNILEKAGATQ